MTDMFAPEEELLARGTADWVDFAEALGLVRQWSTKAGLDWHTEVRRVLRTVIESGWAVPGDVQKGSGFTPWPLTQADSLAEIFRRSENLGREPMPGDICWLQNTPEGDKLGERAIAEHGPTKSWIFE